MMLSYLQVDACSTKSLIGSTPALSEVDSGADAPAAGKYTPISNISFFTCVWTLYSSCCCFCVLCELVSYCIA